VKHVKIYTESLIFYVINNRSEKKKKESHEIQIFISRRTKAKKTQSDDIEDVYSDIYQSEITDRQ